MNRGRSRVVTGMPRSVVLLVASLASLTSAARPARADLALPAHYAALFEPGKAWTYDVAITTWDYEKLASITTPNTSRTPWPKATARLVAVCRVAQVATLDAARVSQVVCDREIHAKFDRMVPGIYAADRAGLHRLDTDALPTTAAELALALSQAADPAPVIAAAPRVRRTTRRDDFDRSITFTTGVRRAGAAWCGYTIIRGASHDGTVTLCLDGGVASGGDDVAAELDDVQFRARGARAAK